jgi:ribokinase
MAPRRRVAALTALLAACAALRCAGASSSAAATPKSWRRDGPVLVVGSVNLDTTARVARLPGVGETVTASDPNPSVALGGKGANQAVAAARLRGAGRPAARFACRLGGDAAGYWLRAQLEGAGVDASECGVAPSGVGSGQGLVLLDDAGAATSVVLGGANALGWPGPDAPELAAAAAALVQGASALMLQREVPEHVNTAFAQAARAAGLPVLLDAGGEERPLSPALLAAVDFLCPNESELSRLTGGAPTHTDALAEHAARQLLSAGARAVLVTLGDRGSMLLSRESKSSNDDNHAVTVLRQAPVPLPGGMLVDATAAGDAFRAAFAVALVEGRTLKECMRLGSAAGAAAAARRGAVPSLPTRAEVETLLVLADNTVPVASPAACSAVASNDASSSDDGFQLLFASRLNSMHSRRDLALPGEADTPLGWIRRQGRVAGLDLVYLNHPQHTEGLTHDDVADALKAARLRAGGIATRFPERFRAGAFTNPNATLRADALQTALDGCAWAAALNASELVVWSPYDGYGE